MSPEFLQIVDELAIWKFFPSGKERGTLAIKLAEWCDGKVERARWLLTRVDDFDEYPGPATLRAMVKDKFQPSGALAPYSQEPIVLPPIECQKCSDTGTVLVDGRHAWCDCKRAAQMKLETPNWVDVSNWCIPRSDSRIREEMRAAEVRRKLQHLEGGYGG